ncbi:response regulator transcription factor [Demequina sp. TTPB684]|uniref:response regulator transcription factor n=1 Tax=unclassified Demequina TaxID=2620311 RepID=UPI001CF3F88D|nr:MULTISPECIES: response regulator transcription factor [unclassified Demequina]MCB2412801.1 response regulator transcription factor [Demequina sp. TTPB684]UPU87437.1 response regulator transcription factor [Demequina sp. TMPB413]
MTQQRARILVVDDEPDLRDLLATSLTFAGYETVAVASGRAALDHLLHTTADLVVMDVMMPAMDGFTTVRKLRARGDDVPVLFLTARDAQEDALTGFTVGADDYVTKPFSLAEVAARIEAILRRARPTVDDTSVLSVGDLVLDEDAHEATRAGTPLDLTPTEFALLRYLMAHRGTVLSKARILEEVWGYGGNSDGAIVETYVSYLRRKVDTPFDVPLLHTKRGVGYVLKAPS